MVKKTAITALLFGLMITLNSYTCIFCKRQGIKGKVVLVKGNQMPSPDIKPTPPPGLQTTVYIYELTSLADVSRSTDPSFYTAINKPLVKQVKSGKDGQFKVRLNPGTYSVFIKKGDLFYANIYDDKNNIAPVTVVKKEFTDLIIKADYDAVY